MNGNTDQSEFANGAAQSAIASPGILADSPMLQANVQAFRAEFPQLLKDYCGQWVAFYQGRFGGRDSSKINLYKSCIQKGWSECDLLVYCIDEGLPEYEEWNDDPE